MGNNTKEIIQIFMKLLCSWLHHQSQLAASNMKNKIISKSIQNHLWFSDLFTRGTAFVTEVKDLKIKLSGQVTKEM
jgi:hypothetical protein